MKTPAAPMEQETTNTTAIFFPLMPHTLHWTFVCVLALPLAIPMSLQSQTITNTSLNSPQVQADVVKPSQTLEIGKRELINTNTAARTNQSRQDSPAKQPAVSGVSTQLNFTPEEIAIMQARGFVSQYATVVQPITNRDGQVIPMEDVADLKGKGWTDEDIANAQEVSTPKKQQQPVTLNPTPPDLANAHIWMDNLFGTANATLVADVISAKQDSLQFRCGGKDYDYSGNFTVMLNIPRQHKYPAPGVGLPHAAKILILDDVGGDVFVLQNATIREKSDGFLDAVASGKEWIYSGAYTIQN